MNKVSFVNKTLGIINNRNVDVSHLMWNAHRLGIHVNIFTNQNRQDLSGADKVIVGSLNDKDKLKGFANSCQWVIYVSTEGINSALINYLKQFTEVPQGSDDLDLIDDQSILHVFLDSLKVKALPYITVFSKADVVRALNDIQLPAIIRPVQKSNRQPRRLMITNSDQLNRLDGLFNGDSYLLESLPAGASYFDMTVFSTGTGLQGTLPVLENHYRNSRLDYANVNPKVDSETVNRFHKDAQIIMSKLDYTGALSMSFIVTQDHQVYVDDLNLPLNLENNVFNHTSDNVSQNILRTILKLKPTLVNPLRKAWLIKTVNPDNVEQIQRLWIDNQSVFIDFGSLNSNGRGYALVSAESLDTAEKILNESKPKSLD